MDGETAVADGGPLDGRELMIGDGASELIATMADGSRHRYVRAAERHTASGWVVLRWQGRVR